MKNFIKRYGFFAAVMAVAVISFCFDADAGAAISLAATVAVTSVPEAEVVNPTNKVTTADGSPAVFPEQSVTTGQDAAPEMYEDQYDKLLTTIRPVRTPIDQITRRIARTNDVKAMEFKYGSIGYMDISTTLGTAYSEGTSTADYDVATIAPAKPGIFNRRDIIIVKGVKGYDEAGTTQTNEDLKLWVKNRNGNTSIDVIAINGKKNSTYKSAVPAIAKDTELVRIAKACAELDSQAPGYAIFPTTAEQYCQKFMAQVEQSTIDRLSAKRFDFNLNDQEEATLADMRLGMEGAFLFGTKSKFLDPDTQRNVWTTKGIWNMVTKNTTYSTASDWTINGMIDMTKNIFTGPAAGRSDKRLVVCGSDLLAILEKLFVGNYSFIHKVTKWDLEFTELQTNFGSLMFILDEVFDIHKMPGCGLIIDPEYLEKYNFEKFGRNTLDLNAQGVRDSNAIVLREISAVVLKSPKNHMKIIKSGEAY